MIHHAGRRLRPQARPPGRDGEVFRSLTSGWSSRPSCWCWRLSVLLGVATALAMAYLHDQLDRQVQDNLHRLGLSRGTSRSGSERRSAP